MSQTLINVMICGSRTITDRDWVFNQAEEYLREIHQETKQICFRIIEDDTIVKDVKDADILKFGNYGKFKYTKVTENVYAKDGMLKRGSRITTAFPNRVDKDKAKYKRDFEVCGIVKTAPAIIPNDNGDFLKITIIVPEYNEGYEGREESLTLHELQLECHDPECFDYMESEMMPGEMVYLNGEIVSTYEVIENDEVEDNVRGFGRKKVEKEPQTIKKDYFDIEGGYVLDKEEDELEEVKEFNEELWAKAKAEKEKKESEMLEEKEERKIEKGMGRKDKKNDSDAVPF